MAATSSAIRRASLVVRIISDGPHDAHNRLDCDWPIALYKRLARKAAKAPNEFCFPRSYEASEFTRWIEVTDGGYVVAGRPAACVARDDVTANLPPSP
jgi:hypothetical protein